MSRTLGIIMNGVTGRMGTNQHLIRSILAIRNEGGIRLADGGSLVPEPLLVGRNESALRRLAEAHGLSLWSTDLDAALESRQHPVYFDAATTELRAGNLRKAIAAGKHIYCEKPSAASLAEALEVWRLARAAGIRHGVVQDKLWLPGLQKLKYLVASGFLGRMLSIRGEFGYWVFEGELEPAQRPSWNYRKEAGGGIIVDMLCHWRYVLDEIFAPVRRVSCLGVTHIPERFDEQGRRYAATADDAAYATFELEGGIIAHINSSWAVRVRRDDLLVLQVDGTEGSAVAGLTDCWIQPRAATPRPVWNPDVRQPIDFFEGWQRLPDNRAFGNAFRAQWELYIRHLEGEVPFPWDLGAGARGVQLAELGLLSTAERRWLEVPDLEV